MLRVFKPQDSVSEGEFRHSFRWLQYQAILSIASGNIITGSLLSAYALALGADNLHIGLLAAIPFLFTVFQLPTVLLVERFRTRKLIAISAWVVSRLLWLPVAMVPLMLVTPSAQAVWTVMALAALAGFLMAVTNTAWSSWMKDLVPVRLLGEFYSVRLSLGTLAAAVCSLGAAFLVDKWGVIAPGQPQVNAYVPIMAFASVVGVLGALATLPVVEPSMPRAPGASQSVRAALLDPYRQPGFRRLAVFLFLWGFAVNLATPFFVVYMLTKLHLGLTSVILLTILSQLVNVFFMRVWGPLTDRFGNKVVLSITGSLYLAVVVGWVFTGVPARWFMTVPLLVVLHFLTGVAMSGVTVTSVTMGLKLAPSDKATSFLAGSALATSAGSGIAPVLGGVLASFFSPKELSLALTWKSGGGSFTLPSLGLAGFDFIFLIAFLIGLLAINALALVPEQGVGRREQVLAGMTAQAQEALRGMAAMPGLRVLTGYPYGYLKQVPGLRSIISLTEKQLADLMQESVATAVKGVDMASGMMRGMTQALTRVVSESQAPVAGQGAQQVAIHSVRGAVLGAARDADVFTGARTAVSSAYGVLSKTDTAPGALFWACGYGAVQGAHEAGADVQAAARGAVAGAKDAALMASNDEMAAARRAAEGALEAVKALAPAALEAVRKALAGDLEAAK